MTIRILQGDVREKLRRSNNANGIQCFSGKVLCFHFVGKMLWSGCGAYVTAPNRNFCKLALKFSLAKFKAILGLQSFHTQVRKKGFQSEFGTLVGGGPRPQFAAICDGRFGLIKRSSKRFLQQSWYLWGDLAKRQSLTVNSRSGITTLAHSVGGFLDSYCAVTVNRASQVGQNTSIYGAVHGH